MSTKPLHTFITQHRDEIIGLCLAKAARRGSDADPAADQHGVPIFLNQVVRVMLLGLEASAPLTRTALLHGQELHAQGVAASDVVHSYGDVCQAVTELATKEDAQITPDEFRVLNGCLDDAIAGAVTAFGYAEELEARVPVALVAAKADRLTRLMCELSKESRTANLAFEAVKSGRVGLAGSTGAVLECSLKRLGKLVERCRLATDQPPEL